MLVDDDAARAVAFGELRSPNGANSFAVGRALPRPDDGCLDVTRGHAACKGHWQPRCDPGVMTLRCLIVDDSPRFLDAARGLLERQGIMIVGVASTSAQALQQVTALRPDIALLDIDLGGESGFDLARRLSREASLGRTRMILISTHAEQDYADLIEASPVVGFLSKSALSVDAIRALIASRGDGHSVDPVSGPPGR